MQYSSHDRNRAEPGERRRSALLRSLGEAVRALRAEKGLTMRELGERAGVSERFLVQLETGDANISVARLEDVAEALGTTAALLLTSAGERPRGAAPKPMPVVALLGLRGAGKSSIGLRVARRLRVPFVELDALVAREAGMSLDTIFEMHGEAYFHRLERETLRRLLDECEGRGAVVATGGSIVTDKETFALLKKRTITLWLKARARDHWDRVVAQGDARPMRGRTNAMSELKALLRERKPLYAQAAHMVDTSNVVLDETVERVLKAVKTPAGPAGKVARGDGAAETPSAGPRNAGTSGGRGLRRRVAEKEVQA
jgi:XRE family transcriptional regulator, aerobic/anaerobic benzoate catabolism transcriptional regulator